MEGPLSPQQVAHFDTFGFVHFGGLFSATEVETLNSEMESAHAAAQARDPFPEMERRGCRMLSDRTPLFQSLTEDRRFLGAARQMFGDVFSCEFPRDDTHYPAHIFCCQAWSARQYSEPGPRHVSDAASDGLSDCQMAATRATMSAIPIGTQIITSTHRAIASASSSASISTRLWQPMAPYESSQARIAIHCTRRCERCGSSRRRQRRRQRSKKKKKYHTTSSIPTQVMSSRLTCAHPTPRSMASMVGGCAPSSSTSTRRRTLRLPVRKDANFASFLHVKNRSFCQDRLGTNIGKVVKRGVLYRGAVACGGELPWHARAQPSSGPTVSC